MVTPLTVREFIRFIEPDLFSGDELQLPIWPGDVFAIVSSLLHRTGVTSRVGVHILRPDEVGTEKWRKDLAGAVKVWRKLDPDPPKLVKDCWANLADDKVLKSEVSGLIDNPSVLSALGKLCIICDEVFEGVGMSDQNPRENQKFWEKAKRLLASVTEDEDEDLRRKKLGATLCDKLSVTKVRVLPKAQPPMPGLSFRSLTQNICLCPTVALPIHWKSFPSDVYFDENHCNFLIIPWPFNVAPRNFYAAQVDEKDSGIGWFGFDPPLGDSFGEDSKGLVFEVCRLIGEAETIYGDIHAVILPETALSQPEFDRLWAEMKKRKKILISGISRKPSLGNANEQRAPDFM